MVRGTWKEATEVTAAVIETIARNTHFYMPFDLSVKAHQEYFRGHELTAAEWDETRAKSARGSIAINTRPTGR